MKLHRWLRAKIFKLFGYVTIEYTIKEVKLDTKTRPSPWKIIETDHIEYYSDIYNLTKQAMEEDNDRLD